MVECALLADFDGDIVGAAALFEFEVVVNFGVGMNAEVAGGEALEEGAALGGIGFGRGFGDALEVELEGELAVCGEVKAPELFEAPGA